MLIFDKSTLEGLSVDESVLLDHFYRANIPPIFFVECLADLEFEIKRRKRMTGHAGATGGLPGRTDA